MRILGKMYDICKSGFCFDLYRQGLLESNQFFLLDLHDYDADPPEISLKIKIGDFSFPELNPIKNYRNIQMEGYHYDNYLRKFNFYDVDE